MVMDLVYRSTRDAAKAFAMKETLRRDDETTDDHDKEEATGDEGEVEEEEDS